MLIVSLALACVLTRPVHADARVKTMVIVGDSLTEGYGVTREEAYPALVQKKIEVSGRKWKVVNAGVSGSTAASAPARVTWVLKTKPDFIILALGANDGLRGSPLDAVEQNLSRALKSCRDAHVRAMLIGLRVPPNYGSRYANEVKAMFERLAREIRVPLMPDMLEHVAGVAKLNQKDGLHPNAAGHVVLSDSIYKALDKLL